MRSEELELQFREIEKGLKMILRQVFCYSKLGTTGVRDTLRAVRSNQASYYIDEGADFESVVNHNDQKCYDGEPISIH